MRACRARGAASSRGGHATGAGHADALDAEAVMQRDSRGNYPALEAVPLPFKLEAVIDGRLGEAEQTRAGVRSAGAAEFGDPDRGQSDRELLPSVSSRTGAGSYVVRRSGTGDQFATPRSVASGSDVLLHVLAGRETRRKPTVAALVVAERGCVGITRMDQRLPGFTLLADASAELRDRAAAATLLRLLSRESRGRHRFNRPDHSAEVDFGVADAGRSAVDRRRREERA